MIITPEPIKFLKKKHRGQIVYCIGNPIIVITQFHKKVQLEPFYFKVAISLPNLENYVFVVPILFVKQIG